MSDTFEIRDLYRALRKDEYRRKQPFSPDVMTAHDVLLDPFATETEKKRMLASWLQKPCRADGPGHQPCLFGRIAARDAMHYCILDENVLVNSDAEIKMTLASSLRDWKRRSVDPDQSLPAHGFMVLLGAKRIAEAAPDDRLLALALAFRKLWGCVVKTDTEGNDVAFETLYLKVPGTERFVKFTFSIDYFGAQGDGRWWHDHRVPGGMAFTANSAGHMKRYREWYEKKTHQSEWLVRTAMLTIDEAADTPYGKATWLRELTEDGRPFVDGVGCPIAKEPLPQRLVGKDWTRYGGHLYSDHSIRREFFRTEPEKPSDLTDTHWLEDFTYIYDGTTPDHVRFIEGEPASLEDIEAELGKRREWRTIQGPRPKQLIRDAVSPVPEEHAQRIASALDEAQRWALTVSEISEDY